MESKFHRWWLGSCVAALLLASWAGGFSVAVTAVFVVVYLTGVTLVGPEDEADIGLADGEDSAEPQSGVAPALRGKPPVDVRPAPETLAEEDAEPYPDDEEDPEQPRESSADTEAVHASEDAGEPEPSPA